MTEVTEHCAYEHPDPLEVSAALQVVSFDEVKDLLEGVGRDVVTVRKVAVFYAVLVIAQLVLIPLSGFVALLTALSM